MLTNNSNMEIRELTTLEQMLEQLELMQQLYPKMTQEKYRCFLKEMIPKDYTQIAVFKQGRCLGLTGCWSSTKLWSGKYLEIDNFIVDREYRSNGIGKLLTDFIEEKAKKLNCTNIVLDAFTTNFDAHRFYYNQGYGPKGFHFVKILDPEGLT
ncbi:GNAT family N-acetyltransferase [Flavobacterium sp. SM15]|uniref:GNAT family N-acetyltransferase n=1 Tax=Flavobacterium sp. SM15 TaxID=2908005 RepID=UPI001EDBDEB3|nr:GNAT family N-acetyltransferase [Flavobacterium sp. SM15]MCG2610332.1 GNAT family N-acetyltransferase [Flavobacterium sp. SM15]